MFHKELSIAAISLIALLAAPAAQAQNQSGRFVLTTRSDIVLECNLDASSCFNVTGAVQSAGDPGGGGQDPSRATEPSIAHDGTVAFDALFGPDGSCIPGAQGICQNHVFLMNADGTNVRQITFNPVDASNFGGDNYASISPDGTMVAFVAFRDPAPDGTWHPQVYLVNADGSNLRQVTSPVPDGNGNYYGEMYGVAWSPDSRTLAYRGSVLTTYCGTFFNQPEAFDVVGEIGLDGAGNSYLACITHNGGSGRTIDWSPDGTLIAYNREGLGDPVIAFVDLSGSRFPNGLTASQLGVQPNNGGQICPSDAHCVHFSPDSTQLAYENNSPSDNPSFSGISTINLDGSGRSDAASFGLFLDHGIWWDAGAYPAAAAQLTVAPNTVVEVWPGFSQQLVPSLLDASNNLILHTAQTYNVSSVYYPTCSIQIGPYGLAIFGSIPDQVLNVPYISVGNEGLTSNSVPLKCWPSSPCTYNLSSGSQSFSAAGGPGSVGVTPDPGSSGSTCPWGPMSSVPWITITAGVSGAGNGSVGFQVAANTGDARQGTITIGGSATFTVSQDAPGTVVLQSISVSPDPASVPAGLTQQLTATGQYSDGSTKDLTASATWSSSNTAIATVGNTSGTQGLASGVMAGGPVTITAAFTAVSGTSQLTVTAPTLQSITVSPAISSVAAGLMQPFTATGHYSDSSTQTLIASVTWSSSNTGIATVSNSSGSQGVATGVAAGGPATIAASLSGVTGTAQLTVTAPVLESLAIAPPNPSAPVGSTQQFTATGSYSDGSTQNITSGVTWASSNPAVATIGASGLASASAAGATTISAKQGNVSNSTTMTVITLQSIAITPAKASLFPGSTLQFTATGKYSDGTTRVLTSTAVWTSSKTMVATITSPGGLATAVGKGTTTIKGTVGGISGSATLTVPPALQSISVSPATATIVVGATQQFLATGNYSDGSTKDVTNSVAWSSSSKHVASVSGGLAIGIKAGTANISAKSGAVTGSAALTVQ